MTANINYPIELKNLTKKFGKFPAVNNVTMSIPKGQIYALIGPNGAGKTTLIKCTVGLLSPTSGKAFVMGHNVIEEPVLTKEFLGYVPDDPSAYDYLNGYEFLMLTGNLRKIKENILLTRIKELEQLFPIVEILKLPISSYSRGNKQKLAFIASLLTKPQILIIDEPIAGLDPQSIYIFGKTIKDYARVGNTVFLVSHSLPFVEKYADIVGFMSEGRILKENKMTDIKSLEKFFG